MPAPPAPLELQPPRLTRARMEAARSGHERFTIVYGTQDAAAAPALRAQAAMLARRFAGADSARVLPDRVATAADLAAGPLVLLGPPRQNAWTRRLAAALPVTFTATGFRWQGAAYERPDERLRLAWPNPLANRHVLLLLAANVAAPPGAHAELMFGDDDWRIERAGELVRAGTFAQTEAAPWHYDPALDRDRDAERARFARGLRVLDGGTVVVRAPAGFAPAEATLGAARALLARLDAAGLGAPNRTRVTLTLYRSLEEKGVLARDTRPEHLDGGTAHAAPAAGREGFDLWSVAAARLVALGGVQDSRFLAPAGAWLCGRLEGEPLERAVSRLYFGRVLPTATEAATRAATWRSPLVWTPARAVLARAVWESAAPARRRAALLALLRRDPPGALDSLCAVAGVSAAHVTARYRLLADSLARAGQRALALRVPASWRPADGFERGVCLAHVVSLENGYLSGRCARELRTLADAGAGWVSLSPFGYLPGDGRPEIWPSAQGGPEEESDEAVCEAAARARAAGLRVWLVPQLWSRAWVGELQFGVADWPRFFDRYDEFVLHYALLAARERMDGLCIGHELASATARDPARWRLLAAEARAVYGGTLTYAANWDEAARVPFWDALDVIGVTFHAPLAAQPTRDPAVLRAGAAHALANLQPLARRFGRPVLLAELGYAPRASAPVRPWEEGGGPVDLDTQRACYRAVVDAMEPCDWLAGALWWNWPSGGGQGEPGDPSVSPRGKPAEAVLRESLRRWQGRPVRVYAAAH